MESEKEDRVIQLPKQKRKPNRSQSEPHKPRPNPKRNTAKQTELRRFRSKQTTGSPKIDSTIVRKK